MADFRRQSRGFTHPIMGCSVLSCFVFFSTATSCSTTSRHAEDDPEAIEPVPGEPIGGLIDVASGGSSPIRPGGSGAGDGGSIQGQGGARGGHGGAAGGNECPVELLQLPAVTGPPLVIDGGYPTLQPIVEDGRVYCPNGTVPSERFTCEDAELCLCEYPCSSGCGAKEICSPMDGGNVCSCHPSLEGKPGDCQWTGLFDTEVFADCDAWHFRTFDNGFQTRAEVSRGTLHLAVERRCQSVSAQIIAQRPSVDVFPEGAALVFDYAALHTREQGQPPPSSVTFGTDRTDLNLQEQPRESRMCTRLSEYPRLVELNFAISNNGTCTDEIPAELWVGNLRFEADDSCGP